MPIRLALLASVCLLAAGCTHSVPDLGSAFSSLREPEAKARTCRDVAADAVRLSGRAALAAGTPPRDPRVGEAGITEVAWPNPMGAEGTGETDAVLVSEMEALRGEADAAGCAIAFRAALPEPVSEPVPVTPPAVTARPEAERAPPGARSAWNPVVGRPAATAKPFVIVPGQAQGLNPDAEAPAASARPASRAASVASVAAPAREPTPTEGPVPVPAAEARVPVAAKPPAPPRTEAVVSGPRKPVTRIPGITTVPGQP